MADISSILSELLAGQRQQIQSSNPYLIASSIVPQVQQRKGKGATSSIVANALLGLTKGALAGYGTADANSEFNDYVSGMVPMLNNPAGMYDKKYAPIASALAADQAMRTAALDDKRIDKGLDFQNSAMLQALKGQQDLGNSIALEDHKNGAVIANPVKSGEIATGLRKELNALDVVKAFPTIDTAYKQILQAVNRDDPGSGIQIIYRTMKILDPGSTVREGEYANANNAGGVPGWMQSIYNKAVGDNFVPEAVRKSFAGVAEREYATALDKYNQAQRQYMGEAKIQGIDPSRVSFSGEIAPESPVPQAAQIPKFETPMGQAQNGSANPNPMPTPMADPGALAELKRRGRI